jgi:protein-L-isoaspartate(D-aspartate) O-methyltransferase
VPPSPAPAACAIMASLRTRERSHMQQTQAQDPYAAARRRMVEDQLRARGIKDPRVLAAFGKVPRHCFVPPSLRSESYEDHPLPIGHGQTISQPYMVAVMTELLELTGGEKVLEVGAGSGYQAAILAELCRELVTVERFAELAERAQRLLTELGYANIEIVVGDGSCGCPLAAPFDRIIVTAAAPDLAAPWVEQLAEGGKVLAPVGSRWTQSLVRLTKRTGEVQQETFGGCMFVPLIGAHGWSEGEIRWPEG